MRFLGAQRLVTTGLFTRVTETTRDTLLGGKTTRTPVALPTDVADAKSSVAVGHIRPAQTGPGHAGPGHVRPRTGLSAGDRKRLGTAIGGLVAIFLVLTVAGVAARHIHVTPVNTSPSTPGAAAGAKTGAPATEVARLSDATTAAASASAALPAQMANIPFLPTPQQVSTVTGPYVDSLQLYEAVLAGTTAPAAATKPIRALEGQLRSDIATFGAAQSVKPTDLGPFLKSFDLRVIALQADMTKLQQTHHPAAARTGSHAKSD
jgi:hypothetical protein